MQFKKIVNIFYIITGILNFFPSIAVNSPIVVILPTLLIMLIGVAKEFVSEFKRYKEDKIVNATPVKRLALPGSANFNANSGELAFEDATLAEIKCGDVLMIEDGKQVPADCVLLRVKDSNPECFVKTGNLDGERNLKPKLANEQLSKNLELLIGPKADQSSINLSVACIQPE